MPEPKYTYIISDPNESTTGAATTLKKAIAIVEKITHDDVEVDDKYFLWEGETNIFRYELDNGWYIDKITMNQI